MKKTVEIPELTPFASLAPMDILYLCGPKTTLRDIAAFASYFRITTGACVRALSHRWKQAAMALSILAWSTVAFSADRLESVEDDLSVTDMHRTYHRLWERKLLQPHAIAQFVSAPGGGGSEVGISISRMPQHDAKQSHKFHLVVKEASSSLWSVVVARYERRAKQAEVNVTTCDVALPESTALAAHAAWLKMLQRIDPAPEQLVLDSTREIFFARTPAGRLLRARLPLSADLGVNNKRLLEIASLLSRSCHKPKDGRALAFRKVEQLASAIIQQ